MGTAPRIKRGDGSRDSTPTRMVRSEPGFGCGGLTVPSAADQIGDVLERSAVLTCISAASGDCALAA
jgi:hypothetical protein